MKTTTSQTHKFQRINKQNIFPMRLLISALILTGALFIGFIWQIYNAGFVQADLQEQIVKSERLQSSIANFDEILTMSAKMSAEFSPGTWKTPKGKFFTGIIRDITGLDPLEAKTAESFINKPNLTISPVADSPIVNHKLIG